MKRLRLATKLALAIVPIALLALATGGLFVWNGLEAAEDEGLAAQAARVAALAVDSLDDVGAEHEAALRSALGEEVNVESLRTTVDSQLSELRSAAQELALASAGEASGIGASIVGDISRTVGLVGRIRESDPLSLETEESIDTVGEYLTGIMSQSSYYLNSEARAREGDGVIALAEASLASTEQERLIIRDGGPDSTVEPTDLARALESIEATVEDRLVFAATSSPSVQALGFRAGQVLDDDDMVDLTAFPTQRDATFANAASDIITRVADAASADATAERNEALLVAGVVLGTILLATIVAITVGRSLVRRVAAVTNAAHNIAHNELPRLVDSLKDPTGELVATTIDLDQSGSDEVGELARSFGAMHTTLINVANEQMETLRSGVSDIFVTLARRNRSLVDRQLSLIDTLESDEEDAETLKGYYELDHLATRMRRNAESLLVLAGTETPRMWSNPLGLEDVVRAALGEVDDYQRVDILAVEPATIPGRAVTDLAHLISELLDNATSFSPPTERVRVTGLFDDDGYVISIADNGVGMSEERISEFNRLMQEPPVLGLVLEPTLGMYVVGRLAKRHDIGVRLVRGAPGVTARITLPRTLLNKESVTPAPEVDRTLGRPTLGLVPDLEGRKRLVDSPRPAAAGGPVSEDTGEKPSLPQRPAPLPADRETSAATAPTERPTSVRVPAAAYGSDRPQRSGKPGAHGMADATSAPRQPAHLPSPARDDSPTEGQGGLPTRTPGASFKLDENKPASSAASRLGAAGLRDALVGYKTGAQEANTTPSAPDDPDRGDHERNDG